MSCNKLQLGLTIIERYNFFELYEYIEINVFVIIIIIIIIYF